MKKVHENSDTAVYRSGGRILLVFSLCIAALSVLAVYVEVSRFGCVILILMSLGSFVVSLNSESLVLDFKNKKLVYKIRFGGVTTTKIEDGFEQVRAIFVGDNSMGTRGLGEANFQAAWGIVLEYVGPLSRGIDIGIYVTKEEAVHEAQVLSEKMDVRLEVGSAGG